jgi:hypothetical protein
VGSIDLPIHWFNKFSVANLIFDDRYKENATTGVEII